MPSIGKRIREALREKGYSQSDLARRLGVTPATVSNWINRNHVPEARIEELEEVLGPLRTKGVDQRLRESRTEADLSRGELARRAKLSLATIDNIEEGKTTNPQKGTIAKLRKVLPGFDLDDGEKDHEDNVVVVQGNNGNDNGNDGSGNGGNGNDGNQAAELVGDLEDFLPHDENDRRDLLDGVAGIYVLLDQNDNAVYVGKSDRNIGERIRVHSKNNWYNERAVKSAKYTRVKDENTCRKIESMLIQLLRPQINRQRR